jgi:hypothetical protein
MAASSIFALLKRTQEAGAREILLVAAQEEFVRTSRLSGGSAYVKAADISIVAIECLDLRFEPRPWPWAEANRAFVERHFKEEREKRPGLWNGRVLVLHRFAIEAGVFRGAYLDTDFASFLAWRDAGFPDPSVRNCFLRVPCARPTAPLCLAAWRGTRPMPAKFTFPPARPIPATCARTARLI